MAPCEFRAIGNWNIKFSLRILKDKNLKRNILMYALDIFIYQSHRYRKQTPLILNSNSVYIDIFKVFFSNSNGFFQFSSICSESFRWDPCHYWSYVCRKNHCSASPCQIWVQQRQVTVPMLLPFFFFFSRLLSYFQGVVLVLFHS